MKPTFRPSDAQFSEDADDSADPAAPPGEKPAPVSVYVCSAAQDRADLDTLLKHLSLLPPGVVLNHVGNVPVGARVRGVQDARLRSAHIAIVLITPDLVATDECRAELQTIFERARRNQLSIIPVRVRDCDLGASQLSELLLLPRSGVPIAASEDSAQAWTEVAKAVRARVEKIGGRLALPEDTTGVPAATLLVVDCSGIPTFGHILSAYLANRYLVTIRRDLEDASHRTHDFTVLCAPASALDPSSVKTALQLAAAEEERRAGRIVVLMADENDSPLREVPQVSTVHYDPAAIQSNEPPKLEELHRCAMVISRQFATIKTRRAALTKELLRNPSDMFNSMRRLTAVIVDLRDVLIELPGKLGSSIKYPEQFAATRASIAEDVRKIANPFFADARNCGTAKEFELLVAETVSTIQRLPHYYDPLFEGQSWSQMLETVLTIVLSAQSSDEDGATKRALGAEVDRRLSNTVLAYVKWWEDGQHRLRAATNKLLDALRDASLSLNEQFLRQQARLSSGA